MGEPNKQYQSVDLLEFKRRLQARVESARTSNEDPLEELARVIGGNGHIIPANADVRPAPVFEKTRFAEARVETSSEPRLALTTFDADTASPHLISDELASDLSADLTDDIESDRVKWTTPSVGVDDRLSDQTERDEEFEASHPAFDVGWQDLDAAIDYEGEAFSPTQSDHAYLRLRNHRRRSISLYATSAAALAVAGALVAVFVRPGVSVGVAPAPSPTSTAMVIRPSLQPDVVPVSQSASSDSAALASGAQLSSVPPAAQSDDPVSPTSFESMSVPASDADTDGAAAATAAPQNSATSTDSLFFQPRRVQTIAVNGDGSYASPADATPTAGQSDGDAAGGQGQTAQAQPFQVLTTQPAAPDTSPPDDQDQTVASREPTPPITRSVAKPAIARSNAGGDADAILASTKAEADARAMLGTLQKKYGAALAGHRLSYHRVKHSNGTAFEVRVAGLGSPDAQALCDKVTKTGGSCQVGSR